MESSDITSSMSEPENVQSLRKLLVYGILIIICIAIVAFLFMYIQFTAGTNTKTNGMEDFSNKPTVSVTSTPTPTPTLIRTTELKITSPVEGDLVGATLNLSGEMKGFFEGVLNYRLLDSTGATLIESNVVTEDQLDQFKPFEQEVAVPATTSRTGKLVFYEVSAKDGSENILLTVNVKF